MNSTLQAQIDATQDLDILGVFCWWSVSKANISHHELEQWFKDNNLNPDLLISAPTYEGAFVKACNKINRQKFDENVYLIRPVLKDQNRVVIAVVKENEVAENLEHRQEFKIILDRNGGALISEQPENPISLEIVKQYLAHKDTHDSMDVCRQILEVVNSASALHVRDRGGIYFILNQSKSTVDKLEKFVKEFGFGNFYAVPQLNIAKVREAISAAFFDDAKSDIQEFGKQVAEWGEKNPHSKSIEKVAIALDVTKEKIKTYARVLKLDVTSFEQPISSIHEGIKKLSQRKIKLS